MVSVKVLRPNLTVVCIGRVQLWFSYSALVAFEHPLVAHGRRLVSENQWSSCTGKHLTEIDGRRTKAEQRIRVAADQFNALVKQYIETIGDYHATGVEAG